MDTESRWREREEASGERATAACERFRAGCASARRRAVSEPPQLASGSGPAASYARQVRTIDWVDGAVVIIDQTALPAHVRWLRLSTVEEMVDAIARLAVRGAPAIGVAGAMGVAIAARTLAGAELDRAVRRLETARPTAVNLSRGVRVAAA